MESDDVTDATLCLVEQDFLVHLPKTFLHNLNVNESDKLLVVLTKKRRMLRIIPTGPVVYKISLRIEELPETIANVASALAEAELEPIYSTGMCYKSNVCIWEGYIDFTSPKLDIEDIKDRLSCLDGLISINIDKIE